VGVGATRHSAGEGLVLQWVHEVVFQLGPVVLLLGLQESQSLEVREEASRENDLPLVKE